MTSPFDNFAWIYDRYFALHYEQWQRKAIDRLLLSDVRPGAHILDLCCGTGNLARRLTNDGYRVTGIDASDAMLKIARSRVPGATFLQADAVDFTLEPAVDAAVCGFDSLNNIMTADQLLRVFENVHAALLPQSLFVFDVNTSAAYGERWDQSYAEVHDDHAFFVRGGFDREARIGRTCVTVFRLEGAWQRSDTEIHQRPWEIPELEAMLRASGFGCVKTDDPQEDLGMSGPYGIGRVFFRAWSE